MTALQRGPQETEAGPPRKMSEMYREFIALYVIYRATVPMPMRTF